MPRVLTDGKTSIGAFMFPDRKRPAICIQEEGTIKVYGYFNTKEGATEFVNRLGEMVGARFDGGEEDVEGD